MTLPGDVAISVRLFEVEVVGLLVDWEQCFSIEVKSHERGVRASCKKWR